MTPAPEQETQQPLGPSISTTTSLSAAAYSSVTSCTDPSTNEGALPGPMYALRFRQSLRGASQMITPRLQPHAAQVIEGLLGYLWGSSHH